TNLNTTLQDGWDRGLEQTDDLLALAGVQIGALPLTMPVDALLISQQVGSDIIQRVSADFRDQARRVVQMSILGNVPAFTAMQNLGRYNLVRPIVWVMRSYSSHTIQLPQLSNASTVDASVCSIGRIGSRGRRYDHGDRVAWD